MPFFVRAEAGSAVSDLLDERLRRLQQQLQESNKSCEGLASQVEAFNKCAREMCRTAGSAVAAIGRAIALDDSRTMSEEEGEEGEFLEAFPSAGEEGRESRKQQQRGGRRSSSLGNREPARSELLALQLVECSNEMEEHLKGEVLNPLKGVLTSPSVIQDAIRNRSRAADNLASAHNEYARAISRYQSSGDSTSNGRSSSDVEKASKRVMAASEIFAEAHGAAEEALKVFLVKRGKVLREGMASLKAVQAGFFVRASRCVSSSVGLEPGDRITVFPIKYTGDASRKSPISGAVAVTGKRGDREDGERNIRAVSVGGKALRSGDKEFEMSYSDHGHSHRHVHGSESRVEPKRRQSIGWFTRISSPFKQDMNVLDEDQKISAGARVQPSALPQDVAGEFEEKSRQDREAGIRRVSFSVGGVGTEVTTTSDGEDSESDSTEGFGSDDAGRDLWDEADRLPRRPFQRYCDRYESDGSGIMGGVSKRVDGVHSDGEATPSGTGGAAKVDDEGYDDEGDNNQDDDSGGNREGRFPLAYPTEETSAPLKAVPGYPLPPVMVDKEPQTSQAQQPNYSNSSNSRESPDISESTRGDDRESPRVWRRLSWWGRPSDRHSRASPVPAAPPPPAPDAEEEAAYDVGSSHAAVALASGAATGGEEAAAGALLSAGGGFAPAFNAGGDAPAVVDGGSGVVTPVEEAHGVDDRDKKELGYDSEGLGTATTVSSTGEREVGDNTRQWQREKQKQEAFLLRRRLRPRRDHLNPLRLSVEKLEDPQERALEAAVDFFDIEGLGRACGVGRAWKERLGGESGRGQWTRCVRLPRGVPDRLRARFYLHVLYDRPAWVSKTFVSAWGSTPGSPGEVLSQAVAEGRSVFDECLAKADEEEAEAKVAMATEANHSLGEMESVNPETGMEMPLSLKWLEEIETDVLRTCPADDTSDNLDGDASADVNTSDDVTFPTEDVADPTEDVTFPTEDVADPTDDVTDRSFDIMDFLDGKGSDGRAEGRTLRSALRTLFGNNSSSCSSTSNSTDSMGVTGAEPLGSADNTLTQSFEEEIGDVKSGRMSISRSLRLSISMRRRISMIAITGGVREKLRRVLRAFAVHNRRVSYCQGMNFVALALLEACEGDDENAFWVLTGMCHRLQLEGLWSKGLERLDLCFFSLDRLLKSHCPSLKSHLASEGVELSMFTSRWFVTLFTSTDVFGRSTSRKIVDMFMVEGWPLLFRLSLVVLLEMRPLLESTDMEGILKITKFPRAHIFGLRRDGTGRRVAGASFEEVSQGSLCEAIRARHMVDNALRLNVSEETLEQHLLEYRMQRLPHPGSD